jgi:DNA modification methylase
MFPPCEERIIWAHAGEWKWNQDSNRYLSVWRIDSEKWSDHPLAYPVQLPLRCLEATTDMHGLVADPFMGSGTTGVACIRTGRRFIGIEREPKYFDIAVKRIETELKRTALFEPVPKVVQAEMFGEAKA